MHIETYVNATFEQVRLSVMLIRLWVLGRVFQKVSLCSLWQSRCGCLEHGWSGLSVVDSAVHWAFGPACGCCDGSLELQALDTHCQHLSCFYLVDGFFAWHGKFELCCLMYLYCGFGVLKPDMYRILIGCPDLIVYCLSTCRLPAASGKVFMVSLRWPSCGFTAVALFQSARYICVHSCHQQPAYTTLQLQPEVHMPVRPIYWRRLQEQAHVYWIKTSVALAQPSCCWGSQRVRQGARGRASFSADTVNM